MRKIIGLAGVLLGLAQQQLHAQTDQAVAAPQQPSIDEMIRQCTELEVQLDLLIDEEKAIVATKQDYEQKLTSITQDYAKGDIGDALAQLTSLEQEICERTNSRFEDLNSRASALLTELKGADLEIEAYMSHMRTVATLYVGMKQDVDEQRFLDAEKKCRGITESPLSITHSQELLRRVRARDDPLLNQYVALVRGNKGNIDATALAKSDTLVEILKKYAADKILPAATEMRRLIAEYHTVKKAFEAEKDTVDAWLDYAQRVAPMIARAQSPPYSLVLELVSDVQGTSGLVRRKLQGYAQQMEKDLSDRLATANKRIPVAQGADLDALKNEIIAIKNQANHYKSKGLFQYLSP